jgi:ATP-dependent helicase HrpB
MFGSARQARRQAAHRSESDVVDRVVVLEEFAKGIRPVQEFNAGAAHFVMQVKNQLVELLQETCGPSNPSQESSSPATADEALERCLLAAFPDRVARRREISGRRGVMVGGRGVRLADESAVGEAELFVCVDVDAGANEALVRQASAIQREWLDPQLVSIRDEVTFDPRSQRVVAFRQTCWDDLVLDEVALAHVPEERIAAALAEAAANDLDRRSPKTTISRIISNACDRWATGCPN